MLPTTIDINKPKYCQDLRHGGYPPKGRKLYPHSTKFYNPDLFLETGKLSYWACEECVKTDYELFDRVGKDMISEKIKDLTKIHKL